MNDDEKRLMIERVCSINISILNDLTRFKISGVRIERKIERQTKEIS